MSLLKVFETTQNYLEREIDAQKRVIFEIKSPFNLRLEPEFSTGSPVGEPNDLNLEPIIDELRELHRILYIPSTYGLDVHAGKTTTFN